MAIGRTLAAALAALTASVLFVGAPSWAARRAPSGLVYSSASALVIQNQGPAGSCRSLAAGLDARPDPRCTPGTVNPAVTQAMLGSTICRSGWTSTVRPAESVTAPEK